MGKLTAARVIDALQRTDGLVSDAAKLLRCSRSTVHNYINAYSSVAAALKDVRERLGDLAEKRLYQAVDRGESWAICFYLKCQFKDRNYVERPPTRPAVTLPFDPIEAIVQARGNAIARREQQRLTSPEIIDVTPSEPTQL